MKHARRDEDTDPNGSGGSVRNPAFRKRRIPSEQQMTLPLGNNPYAPSRVLEKSLETLIYALGPVFNNGLTELRSAGGTQDDGATRSRVERGRSTLRPPLISVTPYVGRYFD
jgi:hypothetical protein